MVAMSIDWIPVLPAAGGASVVSPTVGPMVTVGPRVTEWLQQDDESSFPDGRPGSVEPPLIGEPWAVSVVSELEEDEFDQFDEDDFDDDFDDDFEEEEDDFDYGAQELEGDLDDDSADGDDFKGGAGQK